MRDKRTASGRKKLWNSGSTQRRDDLHQTAPGSKRASPCKIVENAFNKWMTKEAHDRAVTQQTVSGMMPAATAERTRFEKFCRKMAPWMPIPSQRTVVWHTGAVFGEKKMEITEELRNKCTVDALNSSPMGMSSSGIYRESSSLW